MFPGAKDWPVLGSEQRGSFGPNNKHPILFQTDLDLRSQVQGGRVATFWSNINEIGVFLKKCL